MVREFVKSTNLVLCATSARSQKPTPTPTVAPTHVSTIAPSCSLTPCPTVLPGQPSRSPTAAPTAWPTAVLIADLTFAPTVAPSVVVLSSALETLVNPASKTVITGKISMSESCIAVWSVDNFINITRNALTSVFVNVEGNYPLYLLPLLRDVNMVLAENSLVGGETYTFTLSCADVSSNITVTTNQPPTGGKFAVVPANGLIGIANQVSVLCF